MNRVAKGDSLALDDLRLLVEAKGSYEGAYEANNKVDDEYKTYIASLDELAATEVKAVIEHFAEHEKSYSEKERIYHHYMRD